MDENRPLNRLAHEAAQAVSTEAIRGALEAALLTLLGADIVRMLEVSQDRSGAAEVVDRATVRRRTTCASGAAPRAPPT